MSFQHYLRKGTVPRSPEPTGDLIIVLDDVYDTFNVGSLFRLADATRSIIYACGTTSDVTRKQVTVSSVGMSKSVPYFRYNSIAQALSELRSSGYQIAALEQSPRSVYFQDAKPRSPLALVVGNESYGVNSRVLEDVDLTMEIPMYGVNRSLNLAVAVGIVVYHIRELPNFKLTN